MQGKPAAQLSHRSDGRPTGVEKKALPFRQGLSTGWPRQFRGQDSLPSITFGAADARADIPTGCSKVPIVEAAKAISDVFVVCGIRRSRSKGAIDGGEFGRARGGKVPAPVHDAAPGWRRNTGAADYIPAATKGGIVVIDPNPGVGVGIGGDVRHKAMCRTWQDALVAGAGFVGAQAPAAVLPSHFAGEGAECCATINSTRGRAADGDNIRRNTLPYGGRRIPARG